MKQMKCKSCGGTLIPEDNNEYAYCEYCGSRYKMNENININITPPNLNSNKIVLISIIIFCFIVTIGIFTTYKDFFGNKSKITTDFEVKSFNSKFETYNGTNNKIFVEKLLDDIVTSNKTSDNKILVNYDQEETKNPEEIVEIKHSLKEKDYEISFEYDAKAFIYKVNIKVIE